MKKLIRLPVLAVLGLVFVFSTGAAFIDKETKTGVLELKRKYEELDYKHDRMVQLEHQRHQELLKVLGEIRDLSSKKPVIRVVAPPPQIPVIVETPAVVTTPPAVTTPAAEVPAPVAAPTTAIVEAPAAAQATSPEPVIPEVTVVEDMGRAGVATPEAAPVAMIPPDAAVPPVAVAPVAPLPEIKITIPEDVSQQLKQSQSFALLALIVAGISLVSMGFLVITVRKSDERLRRMVWKSEVDHLRDEVMGGRPHLKVEKSYDRLTLTNTGSVVADEIRLSLGPAPATMKQRLKVLARIEAGEKAEVEIGPQATGGQIYGTLEYKNPDNERIYKDQFVLKVDGVTGELIPIQQAS